jgi:hypothetical protein
MRIDQEVQVRIFPYSNLLNFKMLVDYIDFK